MMTIKKEEKKKPTRSCSPNLYNKFEPNYDILLTFTFQNLNPRMWKANIDLHLSCPIIHESITNPLFTFNKIETMEL